MKVPAEILQAQQLCQTQGWRLPIWIQGDGLFAAAALNLLIEQLAISNPATSVTPVITPSISLPQAAPRIWQIGDADLLGAGYQVHKVKGPARTAVLGHEAEVLIINAFSAVDWELVAATSGTLKAGGLWILVSPPIDDWLMQPNAAAKRLLSFPQQPQVSLFAQLLAPQLQQALQWRVEGVFGQINRAPSKHSVMPTPPYASAEQALAVQAIHHVVTGHRRRPLVLTAHRGRGKSAALGIAAAQLALQGRQRVVICAPHPAAAEIAQQQFNQLVPGQTLQFIPVDRLIAELPELDLLLIDEAAGLPIPLLEQLTAHYSRLVFATTEHGYEGTGRGFSLRFQNYLNTTCPGWKKLHLSEPIRYKAHDPLEQLVFSAFLLDCDNEHLWKDVLALSSGIPFSYQFSTIPVAQLIAEPELLRQVFALLSLAHYQTSLRDLWALCDDASLQLSILRCGPTVIGVALVGIEGELDSQLCRQIAQGERRVQGHLLAQSLAFHLQLPALAAAKIARIQRIVIHPLLQRRGLGKALLQQVLAELESQQVTLIGTSFGAEKSLAEFWQQLGFLPIRLSHKLEQSSNAPSVLMVKPSHQEPEQITQLCADFSRQLYWQNLQKPLLPSSLLRLWVQAPQQRLSQSQGAILRQNMRQFKPTQVLPLLQIWLNLNVAKLDHPLIEPLIALLWQGQSMAEFEQILRKYSTEELELLFR